jgi:hypothetical protein
MFEERRLGSGAGLGFGTEAWVSGDAAIKPQDVEVVAAARREDDRFKIPK